jgi:preprotein translocase subunit SecB
VVTSNDVDLAAAVRVSRRVELRDIRLSHIAASSPTHHPGALKPHVEHECSGKTTDGELIEVTCAYRFHAMSGTEEPVLDATLTYLLVYKIIGPETVDAADLDHFAYASGTLHSWPFVRQLLFGLTANMGYPPFMLPVHKHQPAKTAKPSEPEEPGDEEENSVEGDSDETVEADSDVR